jgi:hypothetical protein
VVTLLREGMLISDVRADAAGERPAEADRRFRAKRRKGRKDVSSALADRAVISLQKNSEVSESRRYVFAPSAQNLRVLLWSVMGKLSCIPRSRAGTYRPASCSVRGDGAPFFTTVGSPSWYLPKQTP